MSSSAVDTGSQFLNSLCTEKLCMCGKFFSKNTRYTSAYKLICSREYGCILGCRHVLVVSVSSSGVGTVFALLFVRLEKLLFYKGIFFQCSVFFACPPLSTLFLFTEFVYGIVPTIFSVFVYRVPVAPLLPSFASVGAPARARSTLEFQPASSTQSRASVQRLFACL